MPRNALVAKRYADALVQTGIATRQAQSIAFNYIAAKYGVGKLKKDAVEDRDRYKGFFHHYPEALSGTVAP